MSIPTATEIRTFLEGYKVTTALIPDAWIEARRDNFVIPVAAKIIRRPLDGSTTITEYVSGTGGPLIFLSRRNIASLTSIEYVSGGGDLDQSISIASVELLAGEGIIKAISNVTEGGYSTLFAKGTKNIKVIYTVGEAISDDLKEAIIYLCSEQILGYLGARTGGGSITVQGFSRNFGDRGRYQDLRNDLKRQASSILSTYKTSIVGR